ncbi:DUF3306 domain-containing protein [Alkalisalibacterium limincola]|uniref:DUF3306 domain-containing protein n=1 Tax=Alkalisalibacterium limincola TaxID=2699169 RepID=A0A5C8KQR8_9GAMM|nr:DUF3306 domain-containing protein [Alkalisalibacterium limincola]
MARESDPTLPGGEPLLTRLLRRRVDQPDGPESAGRESEEADASAAAASGAANSTQSAASAAPAAEEAPPPSRIDPNSGRPIDELVDADLPAIDSIGPDSDVRAFLGRNISPELRRQALRKLFHQPKFNVVCLCAEYAENYNNFTPMGAIVPHDMKRQIAVQAERLARKALEAEAGSGAASGTGAAAAAAPGAPEPRVEGTVQREGGEPSTKVLSDAGAAPSDAPRPAVDKPQRG